MTNGADLARFNPRPRDEALAGELGLSGKTVIGYVGTHGMAHALKTVLDAAEQIKATDLRRTSGSCFSGTAQRRRLSKPTLRHGSSTMWCSPNPSRAARSFATGRSSTFGHSPEAHAPVRDGDPLEAVRMHGHGHPSFARRRWRVRDNRGTRGRRRYLRARKCRRAGPSIAELVRDPERRAEMSRMAVAAARRYDRTELAGAMLKTLERVNARRWRLPLPKALRSQPVSGFSRNAAWISGGVTS